MTRYLVLIVDCSSSVMEKDWKPNRLSVILKVLETFILGYFEQNPLSQMCIILSRNAISEKITEFSGNSFRHIKELKERSSINGGEMSLQNALNIAGDNLRYIPKYGFREVLIVTGSIATCDPGDIFETIQSLKSYFRRRPWEPILLP